MEKNMKGEVIKDLMDMIIVLQKEVQIMYFSIHATSVVQPSQTFNKSQDILQRDRSDFFMKVISQPLHTNLSGQKTPKPHILKPLAPNTFDRA